MKKIFTIILTIFLMSLCAQAQESRFYSFVDKKNRQAAVEHELQQAVKNKDTVSVRKLLKETNRHIWTKTDAHGNNLFHLCSDEKTFQELYLSLASVREEMLAQKNKTGETPWMSYIMYGKEEIFLTYFPKSSLYDRLKKVSFDLEHSTGLNYDNAITQRDAIVKECSLTSGQTLWQRAHLMCKGLKSGAKGYYQYSYPADYALGMNNAAPMKNKMEQVRDLIADVAPFLVK